MLVLGKPRCKKIIGYDRFALDSSLSDFLVGQLCPDGIELLTPLIPARDRLRGTWLGGELNSESQRKEDARQKSDVHDAGEYNNNVVFWNLR